MHKNLENQHLPRRPNISCSIIWVRHTILSYLSLLVIAFQGVEGYIEEIQERESLLLLDTSEQLFGWQWISVDINEGGIQTNVESTLVISSHGK